MSDDAYPPVPAVQYGLPVVALLLAAGFALSGAGQHTAWYVVRASGVVSYALVTLTVLAGLLVTNRSLPAGQPRADAFESHRFMALLSISAAGFHALTLLLDHYIGFTPAQILVPFTSAYRPVAVALGIMALYAAMAIYGSFYLRRAIGYKSWRALHYGTFAIFTLATYHGILSGADTGQAWMLTVYLFAIVSVLGLLVLRIVKATAAEPAQSRAETGPTAASPTGAARGWTGSRQAVVDDDRAWRRPDRAIRP